MFSHQGTKPTTLWDVSSLEDIFPKRINREEEFYVSFEYFLYSTHTFFVSRQKYRAHEKALIFSAPVAWIFTDIPLC